MKHWNINDNSRNVGGCGLVQTESGISSVDRFGERKALLAVGKQDTRNFAVLVKQKNEEMLKSWTFSADGHEIEMVEEQSVEGELCSYIKQASLYTCSA